MEPRTVKVIQDEMGKLEIHERHKAEGLESIRPTAHEEANKKTWLLSPEEIQSRRSFMEKEFVGIPEQG